MQKKPWLSEPKELVPQLKMSAFHGRIVSHDLDGQLDHHAVKFSTDKKDQLMCNQETQQEILADKHHEEERILARRKRTSDDLQLPEETKAKSKCCFLNFKSRRSWSKD